MERSFLLLICFCANLIGAEFIYSAHISTENHILSYQDFNISPIMTKQEHKKEIFSCTLNEPKPKKQSEYDYLLNHKEKLFDCFFSQKTRVNDSLITTLKGSHSNTQLFIVPLRFKPVFYKQKCEIYVLK